MPDAAMIAALFRCRLTLASCCAFADDMTLITSFAYLSCHSFAFSLAEDAVHIADRAID